MEKIIELNRGITFIVKPVLACVDGAWISTGEFRIDMFSGLEEQGDSLVFLKRGYCNKRCELQDDLDEMIG